MPPGDDTLPRVTGRSPQSSAAKIFPSAGVEAVFSEKFVPATLTQRTFRLKRVGTDTKVRAQVR